MKAKLIKIRDALVEVTGSFHAAVAFDSIPKDGEIINNGNAAIRTADELLTELESAEMVEVMARNIYALNPTEYIDGNEVPFHESDEKEACFIIAQAAINAIKGDGV